MSIELVEYRKPLNEDELFFLQQKANREKHILLKIIRWIMVACFIIPFVVAWLNVSVQDAHPFSFLQYFTGVFILLFSIGSCVYVSFFFTLRKVLLDICQRTKTVERCLLVRKQFMSSNNSYHCYINSSQKLSIEVSEDDYNQLNEGDEICITYSTHSKQYLGYHLVML
jgi:hypothetical protein